MQAEPLNIPQKASFIRSTWEGITGFVKGGVTGAFIGAVLIGGIAALLGAVAPGVMPEAFAIPEGGNFIDALKMAGSFGMEAASIGATVTGTIGMFTGAVTGVVKSREAGQPTAEDVVNVAKIAFSNGVTVGQQVGAAQAMQQQNIRKTVAQSATHHQDKYTQEKALLAMSERQVLN